MSHRIFIRQKIGKQLDPNLYASKDAIVPKGERDTDFDPKGQAKKKLQLEMNGQSKRNIKTQSVQNIHLEDCNNFKDAISWKLRALFTYFVTKWMSPLQKQSINDSVGCE